MFNASQMLCLTKDVSIDISTQQDNHFDGKRSKQLKPVENVLLCENFPKKVLLFCIADMDQEVVLLWYIMQLVTARVARMYRFWLVWVCVCPGAKNW